MVIVHAFSDQCIEQLDQGQAEKRPPGCWTKSGRPAKELLALFLGEGEREEAR